MAAQPSAVRELDLPPCSIEAEHAVLGACLGWPDAYPRVCGQIGAEDFYRDDHRRIWRAMDAIGRDAGALDVVTVSELLEKCGELDGAGPPHLAHDVDHRGLGAHADVRRGQSRNAGRARP